MKFRPSNSSALLTFISLGAWGGISVGVFADQQYTTEFLDSEMEDSIDFWKIRGASIAFFDQNVMTEPILRGYGRTSSSKTNSNKVTPDTAFLLASVSKVFAGTAVMKLVDLGIVSSLDEDICQVVPSAMTSEVPNSACRNPHFPDIPVTWRMLLTHRSSLKANVPIILTNNDDDWGYLEPSYGPTGGYFGLAAGQATCPMEDVTGFYRDILIDKESETVVGSDLGIQWYQLAQRRMGGMWRNDYAPGGKVLYSNFAVGYIAALIEWATEGQTFPDFTRQHIFEPLGMDHTAWFRRDLPSGTVEAVPVETANRRGTRFQDIGHYCFIDYASGSLRSTASDLSKFLQSMLNYGVPDLWLSPPSNGLANNSTINTNSSSSSVLGQESLNCLEKDQNGQPVKASNCEFGANWILLSNAQKKGAEEWLEPFSHYDWTDGAHHDGAEAGSQTQILVLPRAGVYAAVLTNTDGNDEYAAQMMAVDLLYEISGGRPRYATKPLAWGFPVLALLVVSLWE